MGTASVYFFSNLFLYSLTLNCIVKNEAFVKRLCGGCEYVRGLELNSRKQATYQHTGNEEELVRLDDHKVLHGNHYCKEETSCCPLARLGASCLS